MSIIRSCLFLVLSLLVARTASSEPIRIDIPNDFQILVHKQSAAMIDPYAALQPVGALSLWKDGLPSPFCDIVPANLSRKPISVVPFYENNTLLGMNSPLYSFSDLKHLRNAIDLIKFQDKYYIAFEDGAIGVYQLDQRLKVDLQKRLELADEELFPEGYFASNADTLLYVTDSKLWAIEAEKIVAVPGYVPSQDFQNARLVEKRLFVALGKDGFAIYSNVSTQGLTPPDIYNKSNFFAQQPDISDIWYCADMGTLFVLDRAQGVMSYPLGPSGKVLSDNITHYVRQGGCENMAHYENLLLLSCPNLVIFDIATKQLINRPESDIDVQDILVLGSPTNTQVVLVGDSHIAYYFDLKKNPIYAPLWNPTRVLLEENNTLIFMNDYELVQMQVTPHYEIVRCGMPIELPEGLHHLEMHATAACDSSFIREKGLELTLSSDATCEYVTKLVLSVWTERKVGWELFAIIGGVLGALSVLFFLWYCFKNCKFQRKYQQLNEQMQIVSERTTAAKVPQSAIKERAEGEQSDN